MFTLNMSRCVFCQKKTSLATNMKCKWCQSNFCIGCLAIEVHLCSRASTCKQAALNDLSNRLQQSKTSDSKYVHMLKNSS